MFPFIWNSLVLILLLRLVVLLNTFCDIFFLLPDLHVLIFLEDLVSHAFHDLLDASLAHSHLLSPFLFLFFLGFHNLANSYSVIFFLFQVVILSFPLFLFILPDHLECIWPFVSLLLCPLIILCSDICLQFVDHILFYLTLLVLFIYSSCCSFMDHYFTHLFLFEYFNSEILHLLFFIFLFGSGQIQNFVINLLLLCTVFHCELLPSDDLLVEDFFNFGNLSCFICLFLSLCLNMKDVTVFLNFTPLISRNVRRQVIDCHGQRSLRLFLANLDRPSGYGCNHVLPTTVRFEGNVELSRVPGAAYVAHVRSIPPRSFN